MSREKHYHVATTNGQQAVGILEFDDGPQSVQVFINIVREVFRDSYDSDPVNSEMSLMNNLEGEEHGVWAGNNDGFMVIWTKCSCDFQAQYN